jgi:hypothetical protein
MGNRKNVDMQYYFVFLTFNISIDKEGEAIK